MDVSLANEVVWRCKVDEVREGMTDGRHLPAIAKYISSNKDTPEHGDKDVL